MSDRYELPPSLNIYGVLESRDALLAWANEQSAKNRTKLEISAREVAEVDGSGLQLLAALSNMGKSWTLVEHSQVFADACAVLGLSQWLEGSKLKKKKGTK
jgi:ABC-type transporter Mla MlaB component